jgi:hypothetical protein
MGGSEVLAFDGLPTALLTVPPRLGSRLGLTDVTSVSRSVSR